jgi:hypothetical protein
MQKTVRSRFDHEVGDQVEGCTIIEKRIIIPPDPVEKRRGVYDYVVDVPPTAVAPAKTSSRKSAAPKAISSAPEKGSFTRASPEEMSSVIRRVPSR